MQSGKSTCANHLVERYGAKRVSFADAIKKDLEGLGFSNFDLYMHKPDHIRKLMQAYGQAKRAENSNYWVDRATLTINETIDDETTWYDDDREDNFVFVIDDLRFPNEIDQLIKWADHSGAALAVVRVDRRGPAHSGQLLDDVSEIALDRYAEFDYTVVADSGDIGALNAQMDAIIRGMRHPDLVDESNIEVSGMHPEQSGTLPELSIADDYDMPF